MWIAVALCAFVFWGAVFVVFFQSEERSALDYLLGPKEELPLDLGVWRASEVRPGIGPEHPLVTDETRHLLVDGILWRQGRVRDQVTGEILEVFPEEKVVRKRSRSPRS